MNWKDLASFDRTRKSQTGLKLKWGNDITCFGLSLTLHYFTHLTLEWNKRLHATCKLHGYRATVPKNGLKWQPDSGHWLHQSGMKIFLIFRWFTKDYTLFCHTFWNNWQSSGSIEPWHQSYRLTRSVADTHTCLHRILHLSWLRKPMLQSVTQNFAIFIAKFCWRHRNVIKTMSAT